MDYCIECKEPWPEDNSKKGYCPSCGAKTHPTTN